MESCNRTDVQNQQGKVTFASSTRRDQARPAQELAGCCEDSGKGRVGFGLSKVRAIVLIAVGLSSSSQVQAGVAYQGGIFSENFAALRPDQNGQIKWTNDVTQPGWFAYDGWNSNHNGGGVVGQADPNWVRLRYLHYVQGSGALTSVTQYRDRVFALVLSNATFQTFNGFTLSYYGGAQGRGGDWQSDRLDFSFAVARNFDPGPSDPGSAGGGDSQVVNPNSIIPHDPKSPEDFSKGFINPADGLLDLVGPPLGSGILSVGGLVTGSISNLVWQPGALLILRWFDDDNSLSVYHDLLFSLGPLTFSAEPSPAPVAFVNSKLALPGSVVSRGPAQVSLSTVFVRGTIFYTLDGTEPGLNSKIYNGPFSVSKTEPLRAVAYNEDFSNSVQADKLEIVVLPQLTVVPTGGGTVSIDPSDGPWADGETATITAEPVPGWSFLHWMGDADGTTPVASVQMSRSRIVEAVFGTAVRTATAGAGSVSLSPHLPLLPYGTTAKVTAVPGPGSYFVGWSGASSDTTTPTTLILTNQGLIISALFQPLGAGLASVSTVDEGEGHVSMAPPANRIVIGKTVRVTAVPSPGQAFIGWSGDASGTENPLSMKITKSMVIVGQFTSRPVLDNHPPLAGLFEDGHRLVINGNAGEPFTIQGSMNLVDWMGLGQGTNWFGRSQFFDPTAPRAERRFYRVVVSDASSRK